MHICIYIYVYTYIYIYILRFYLTLDPASYPALYLTVSSAFDLTCYQTCWPTFQAFYLALYLTFYWAFYLTFYLTYPHISYISLKKPLFYLACYLGCHPAYGSPLLGPWLCWQACRKRTRSGELVKSEVLCTSVWEDLFKPGWGKTCCFKLSHADGRWIEQCR